MRALADSFVVEGSRRQENEALGCEHGVSGATPILIPVLEVPLLTFLATPFSVVHLHGD